MKLWSVLNVDRSVRREGLGLGGGNWWVWVVFAVYAGVGAGLRTSLEVVFTRLVVQEYRSRLASSTGGIEVGQGTSNLDLGGHPIEEGLEEGSASVIQLVDTHNTHSSSSHNSINTSNLPVPTPPVPAPSAPPPYSPTSSYASHTPLTYAGLSEDVISLRTGQEPYTGLVDCVRSIRREEGLGTLWRGWGVVWAVYFAGLVWSAFVGRLRGL